MSNPPGTDVTAFSAIAASAAKRALPAWRLMQWFVQKDEAESIEVHRIA